MSETISCTTVVAGAAQGRLRLLDIEAAADDLFAPDEVDPETEIERFERVASELRRELESSANKFAARDGSARSEQAHILAAHVLVLEDEGLLHRVGAAIRGGPTTAAKAVARVFSAAEQSFAILDSPVLRERAADLRDLSLQLRQRLTGVGDVDWNAGPASDEPLVLVLDGLLPSIVLRGHRTGVCGFVVGSGTGLSHGAILARSLGLPVVRVPQLSRMRRFAGQLALVDGTAGELILDPEECDGRRCLQRIQALPPITSRRRPVARMWLNLTAPEQLEEIDWSGIEGVGLYRTETLFMEEGTSLPDEYRQRETYARLLALSGDRPVVIRTVDLGGDKMAPAIKFGHQANPYLGLRAHRLYHFHPEILVVQLRAMLRAATHHRNLRILYPMLETIDQWFFIQDLVARAQESLRTDRLSFQEDFKQGVLIETPAATWQIEEWLRVADFVSVGTNDLVQYFFAVERDNADVADLYQPEHPVFLRLLRQLARRARRAGKRLSVCGEIAAQPTYLPLLIGLGIRDLSLAPPAVLGQRTRLDALRVSACQRLAAECVAARTVAEVRDCLRAWHGITEDLVVSSSVGASGITVDPICGMSVAVDRTPHFVVRAGHRHYFCSRACRAAFKAQESH